MDTSVINPFLKATVNVLKTMAYTEAVPQKPRLKEDNRASGDITGVIGMADETFFGAMIVSFSKSCILNICSLMFGEPLKEEIDEEVMDAVGELTNMICGGAKAELAKLDYKFNMATPTLIKGRGVEISYYSCSPTIVIPFETEHGDFVVEANLCTH